MMFGSSLRRMGVTVATPKLAVAAAAATAASSSGASRRGMASSALRCRPSPSAAKRLASPATTTMSTSVSQVIASMPSPSPVPPAPSSTIDVAPSAPPVKSRKERRAVLKALRKESKRRRNQKDIFVQSGIKSNATSPYVRRDRQFKSFKPLTPSLRWVRYPINDHLHKGGPERSLTIAKRGTGGRNNHGHVTVRGRGGGHRRRIRMVDFYRWETGEQNVLRIEYDPGRSAHIALVQHAETGVKSYILAPDGLGAGDTVQSYRREEVAARAKPGSASSTASSSSTLDLGIFRTRAIRPGNVLPLHLIPIGTTIHALSLLPGGPAKLIRSAGASGQLVAFVNRSKASTAAGAVESAASAAAATSTSGASSSSSSVLSDLFGDDRQDASSSAGAADAAASGESGVSNGSSSSSSSSSSVGSNASASAEARTTHAQVKLQSGEVRLVPVDCCAAIGRVSNTDHEHRRIGKAGRSRWLGRRPKVRGVAMNAVDHPHGGGRGKSKSNMHPRSIYGHKVKGPRTRKPGTRGGNQMVVRERPRRNGKRLGKP